MTESDKSKRGFNGTPFRYECAAPIDEVVRALMRLDHSYWLMLSSDVHLEKYAAGYTFKFRQLLGKNIFSEIDAHIEEDHSGSIVIEGMFHKVNASPLIFFIAALVTGIIGFTPIGDPIRSSSPVGVAQIVFGVIAAISIGVLCATFFYAQHYDTVYYVEKTLRRVQDHQMQGGKLKSRFESEESALDESVIPDIPAAYEDDRAYDQKR